MRYDLKRARRVLTTPFWMPGSTFSGYAQVRERMRERERNNEQEYVERERLSEQGKQARSRETQWREVWRTFHFFVFMKGKCNVCFN